MEAREAKRLRTKAAREAYANAGAQRRTETREAVDKALDRFWTVIADTKFVALLSNKGLKSIPCRSTTSTGGPNFGHFSLDFVVAWTFLYPVLADQEIAAYLEANWPNFIIDMKDAFILLVSHGPFPPECRAIGRPVRSAFPSERRQKASPAAKRRD